MKQGAPALHAGVRGSSPLPPTTHAHFHKGVMLSNAGIQTPDIFIRKLEVIKNGRNEIWEIYYH